MKKIVFLIIATLLVIGLVLPGCDGEEPGPVTYTFEDAKITIAIAGPMEYIQGEHMIAGAELARDEINVAGVDIAGHTHQIALVEVDTQEIAQPYPGYSAPQVENAITVQGANFVMGGFRTEATGPMIETAMDEEAMFFIAGSATGSLMEQVNDNYNKYKYLFRATPINETFLFLNCIVMLAMVGSGVMTALNTSDTTDVNVAFLAEDLLWTQTPIASVAGAIGPAGLNYTNVGTWKVSDTADDLTTELNQIKAADAHIIFTFLSGPVGLTYGLQMGELQVPAMTVGINVESQVPTFWDATEWQAGDFGAEGMISLMTWAPNIAQSGNLTTDFLAAFETKTGEFPIYTAATYDMIYGLVEALEDEATWDSEAAIGTVLADDVIGWFEDPANERLITSGNVGYYSTALGGYVDAGVPCFAHDLKYGPAYATGLGVQWRDDNEDDVGEIVGIWPKKEFAGYATALIPFNAALGLNWTGFEWPGTDFYSIPTWMKAEW